VPPLAVRHQWWRRLLDTSLGIAASACLDGDITSNSSRISLWRY
jgi:hypothetical protein